jgi:hypothetical protein
VNEKSIPDHVRRQEVVCHREVMAETASEILFPLAESIASQPPFASSPPHHTVLLSITDAFLLTLSHDLRTEFTEKKEQYLQLLGRYLKRIYESREKARRPQSLKFSTLLTRHGFQQLIVRFDPMDVSTILLSLRNGDLRKLDHLCAALLAIPSHSSNEDLNRVVSLIISAPLQSESDRSLRALACLHAFLLVSTPHCYSLSSLVTSHAQKPSFLSLIAFISLWTKRFPLDPAARLVVLQKTQTLFSSLPRNASKDLRPAKTDPLAIYTIRKWLQTEVALPTSRAVAQEILQRLGQLENGFFGSDCPSFVLKSLSLKEGLTQVRWEGPKGLLSRDDLAEGCLQSLIALVAPKEKLEDGEENPTEAEEDGGDEVPSVLEEKVDSEAEWKSLLKGKKTLKTKAAPEQIEIEELSAPEIDEDEEIGFVIDTHGAHVETETELVEVESAQEEAVEEASAPIPVSEKKRPGRKRKEVAKEEKEGEEETPEESETKTRKSRRVRK